MKLGSVFVGVVLFIGLLWFGAEGYVPAPDWLRGLWDKNWEKQVEPRKEEWERTVDKYRTTPPPPPPQTQPAALPQNYSFSASQGAVPIHCTVSCAA
jgi:hypothetical protein